MLNHNDEAVLIDFGISALMKDIDLIQMDMNMGSYMYFAPELFNPQTDLDNSLEINKTSSYDEL